MSVRLQTGVIDFDIIGMESNLTMNEQIKYNDSFKVLLMLVHTLYQYYVPIIVCIGLVFSFLVAVVLLKTKLRKRFFSHLFAAISVCDIGFLLTILCIWTREQGIDVYIAPGLCQLVIFGSHFFPFLSFWYSISGCLVVVLRGRMDHRNVTMFTGPGKARLLIISLCLFATTIYIYKTWTNGVLIVMGMRVCTVLPENEATMRILNVFDMVLLLVLPFALFLAFDIWLIVLSIARCIKGARVIIFPRVDRSFKIVLAHSILFHLFVAPGCISKLVLIFKLLSNKQLYPFQELLIDNVFQYIFYSYFALKSIMHIMVSKSFRYHAKKLSIAGKSILSRAVSSSSRERAFV